MEPSSRLIVKTLDGLRVALAGIPDDMTVTTGDGLDLETATVRELRNIEQMPCALEILIPYRLRDDSTVLLGPYDAECER